MWNPEKSVIDSCRKMCAGISRILQSEGHHIHISFAQPHFRKKYLLGQHIPSKDVSVGGCEFQWSLDVEKLGGDDASGCFHHFMYIMKRR